MPQHQPSHSPLGALTPGFLCNLGPDVFHNPAIGDPAWTGRLAGAALQAKVPVPFDGRRLDQGSLGNRTCQVDATPWRVHLLAGHQVRRARIEAEAAMDAPG